MNVVYPNWQAEGMNIRPGGVKYGKFKIRLLALSPGAPVWGVIRKNPHGKVMVPMICVVEYGDNIGTLKNMFPDLKQALGFAEKIIKVATEEYTCIGTHQWYCREKNEYLKIESL